jgi:hypothetical protein
MFGLGTLELIILGVLAASAMRRGLPPALHLRNLMAQLVAVLTALPKTEQRKPNRAAQIELVTAARDSSMKKRLQKFMWSPAFCAILGIIGCATGFYFQGVAANGSGLWCLGLIFLGAAYLDKNP